MEIFKIHSSSQRSVGERFYVSQGRCVTGTLYGLCVTGPFCHSAQSLFYRTFHLLQYWLILKTLNFYFLSLYLAQFIDFIGGFPNPNPSPNPNPMTQRPYDTTAL